MPNITPSALNNFSFNTFLGGTPAAEIMEPLSQLGLNYARLFEASIGGGAPEFDTIIDVVEGLGNPAAGDHFIPRAQSVYDSAHVFLTTALGLQAQIDLNRAEYPRLYRYGSTAMTTLFGWDATLIGQTVAAASRLAAIDPKIRHKFINDLYMVLSGYRWAFRPDQALSFAPKATLALGDFEMRDADVDIPIATRWVWEEHRAGRAQTVDISLSVPAIDTSIVTGSFRVVLPSLAEIIDITLGAEANTSETAAGVGTNVLTFSWDDTGATGGSELFQASTVRTDFLRFSYKMNGPTPLKGTKPLPVTAEATGAWTDQASADVRGQINFLPKQIYAALG